VRHTHNKLTMTYQFSSFALQPPVGPGLCFSASWSFYRRQDSLDEWSLVARHLLKHRITQTQNKHIHTPNIHALCGIRTYDHSFRASEDSTCLRPLGYCDRHLSIIRSLIFHHEFCNRRCYSWKAVCRHSNYITFIYREILVACVFHKHPWRLRNFNRDTKGVLNILWKRFRYVVTHSPIIFW
jgi:hypothetical protein